MKRFAAIATIMLAWMMPSMLVRAQSPFTYETPTELSSTGDFDGDGRADLVILDRETGAARVLFQQSTGDFFPGPPQWTGLEATDALTVGKLRAGATADQTVFASAKSNRVLGLGLTPPTAEPAQLNGLLSPTALAAVALPSLPGLVLVATEQNDAPAPRRLSPATYNGGTLSVAAEGFAEPSPLRRGNAVVMRRAAAPGAAFVALASPEASEFRVFAEGTSPLTPVVSSVPDLPPAAQWTYGFFAPLKDHPSFLFYERKAARFVTRQSEEAAPSSYAFTDAGSYDLGKPIHLLLTVIYENKTWLLALFDEGGSAGLYEFDAARPPVSRQQWSAPPGEKFTTAAALGQGGFLLLSGAGGRSANWHRFDYDGSRHRRSASGGFAPLGARDRQVTVFLFDEEPFVTPDALVYELRREGDWTSDSEELVPGSWRLTSLRDGGPADGLGEPATGVFLYPETLMPVINQYLRPPGRAHDRPLSIASFSAQEGAVLPLVRFDPPPGHYPAALSDVEETDPEDPAAPVAKATGAGLPVTLHSTGGSGAAISYRFSPDEPWRTYTAPLRLTSTATIYARTVGSFPAANTASPVVSGEWILGGETTPLGPLELPPAEDANGNGLADAWEDAFNQHDPGADPDGDGKTNLQEYLAGTDPLDPGDVPVQPAGVRPELALSYQVVDDEGTPCLELSWDRLHADAELQYSADMQHWQTLRDGIEFTAEGCRALVPLDTPAASGYFRLDRR